MRLIIAIGLCLLAIAATSTSMPTESSHELEIFPLSQVFNGIRLVRDVAKLLTDGHRPPAPMVRLRYFILASLQISS